MKVSEIDKYVTQVFSSTRYKSKRYGRAIPTFTKDELRQWLFNNNLVELWEKYIASGKNKYKKPSVDRIDDYGIYEFSNMQLVTWGENLIKGVNCAKHHTNSKNENQRKPVLIYDRAGNLKQKCESEVDAAKYLNCHLTSINRVVKGKRKTIKKHIIVPALTGTELTIQP